jgi:hypothetical protein
MLNLLERPGSAAQVPCICWLLIELLDPLGNIAQVITIV